MIRPAHALWCVLALTASAHAGVLLVPGDSETIQGAIDIARPGAEIVVGPGAYNELIDTLGLPLTIRSSDGPEATIISGLGLDGSVVSCVGGEGPDTVIQGFTITGGTGTLFVAESAVVGGGMRVLDSSPSVNDCVFTNNNVVDWGGGVFVSNGAPSFTNCAFTDNTATFGAGLYNRNGSDSTVVGGLFRGNDAVSVGGAMRNRQSSPLLVNCTMSLNSAGNGGGIASDFDSNPTIIGCILWDNGSSLFNTVSSTPLISFSDVQFSGGSGPGWNSVFGSDGGGNIDASPLFTMPAGPALGGGAPDLRLQAGSPAIDAGDSGALGCIPDLDGNARFADDPATPDTGAGDTLIVDMGPYEFGSAAPEDCDTSGTPDDCDIVSGAAEDCNANGVPDSCDIMEGTSLDDDGNGVPDECLGEDCNENNVPDDEDIANGTSSDFNNDGVPDECKGDCNGNGVPDYIEIAIGTSPDCNENGVPDECDIDLDPDLDCNGNDVPDTCDIADGTSNDCNGNGTPDECDIASGMSFDDDGNGVPDECKGDCDGDGIPDPQEIAGGAPDCNGNGIPDECDTDLNANGVPDDCDPDCNENGFPDFIDIAFDLSEDCNGNEIPDECEPAVVTFASRRLSPFGHEAPQTATFPDTPDANGAVTLTFSVLGDFSGSARFASIYLNGIFAGRVFQEVGSLCPATPDVDQIVLSAATFNFATGPDAIVDMVASPDVDPTPGCVSNIMVTIEYSSTAGEIVCEAACPSDCAAPTDAVVNVTDLLAVLSGWGGPGACDVDGSGDVDVADLLQVLSEWGLCP